MLGKSFSRITILLLAVSLLAGACNRAEPTSLPTPTLQPTPQLVRAAITPALRPLLAALQTCAAENPTIALLTDEIPAASIDLSAYDFAIRLGQPGEMPPYSLALGWEQVKVVLNNQNPLTHLSTDLLTDLYTGRLDRWPDTAEPAVIWTYPAENDIQQVFGPASLGSEPITTQAFVAPDPAAVLEAVAAQPGAIGYIPAAWLTGDVSVPALDEALQAALRQPLLALSNQEPQGAPRAILACLQQGAGQAVIAGLYEGLSEGQ